MLTMINRANQPPPTGYSHAVKATGIDTLVFVSGQVGVAEDGSVPASVSEQARLAAANLLAVLAEAGMDASNLTKTTIYLTDAAHIGEFMAGAGSSLPVPPPATTLLVVSALGATGLLVEIEGIAAR